MPGSGYAGANEIVFRSIDMAIAVGVEPSKMFLPLRLGLHLVIVDPLVIVLIVFLQGVFVRRQERLIGAFAVYVNHVAVKGGHSLRICAYLRDPPESLSFIERIGIQRI